MKTEKIAADIAESVVEKDNEITLSTGVKLSLKRVNSYAYIEFQRKHKKPKPPVVFLEEHGREQENPDNPDYIEQLEQWNTERMMGIIDITLILGTECTHVPAGIPKMDSDSWLESLAVAFGGDIVFKNNKERYLWWLKYIASTDEDIAKIATKVALS